MLWHAPKAHTFMKAKHTMVMYRLFSYATCHARNPPALKHIVLPKSAHTLQSTDENTSNFAQHILTTSSYSLLNTDVRCECVDEAAWSIYKSNFIVPILMHTVLRCCRFLVAAAPQLDDSILPEPQQLPRHQAHQPPHSTGACDTSQHVRWTHTPCLLTFACF